jgi:hypothetical protein
MSLANISCKYTQTCRSSVVVSAVAPWTSEDPRNFHEVLSSPEIRETRTNSRSVMILFFPKYLKVDVA